MRRKLLSACIVAALSVGYVAAAYPQAKPETLVKQRQSAMTLQWKYFGPLVAMEKDKVPYDAAVVARNVGYLDTLTKLAWDGFTENTKGVSSSNALPVVFSETAKFKQSQDRLHTAIAALVAASKGGNEGAVKAAISDVDKACGNCHDTFKKQ
jgi:cytochrome c556